MPIRPPNRNLDRLTTLRLPVLDSGFVELEAVMGEDEDVVRAAYTSTGQEPKGEVENQRLINYLTREEHSSPFEVAELKFLVEWPLFVGEQFKRHRTLNWNEASARYVELPRRYFLPDPSTVMGQGGMKQGRKGELEESTVAHFVASLARDQVMLDGSYQEYIASGVAKELARSNRPGSQYTRVVLKCDLRNWLHLLHLRLHPNAQYETRQYAKAIAHFVSRLFPYCWHAFEEYDLYALKLSRTEIVQLQRALAGGSLSTTLERRLMRHEVEGLT